jgi:hypothetical protein
MIRVRRRIDLRPVIDRAVEELGGDPYDLPFGQRQFAPGGAAPPEAGRELYGS